jgi:hypothetical protein
MDRTAKGSTTKQLFPIIKDRLTTKIKLTPNFTAKLRHTCTVLKYSVSRMPLQRREPNCGPSNIDCTKLQRERERERERGREREKLTSSVSKQDSWPVN